MLLPRPTSLRTDSGEFVLSETTSIRVTDPRLAPNARLLQSALRPPTGFDLPAVDAAAHAAAAAGMTDPAAAAAAAAAAITLGLDPALGAEAYRLTTGPDGAVIEGGGEAGVFYGWQALLATAAARGLPARPGRRRALGRCPR